MYWVNQTKVDASALVLLMAILPSACFGSDKFFTIEHPFFGKAVDDYRIDKSGLTSCPDGSDFFAVDYSTRESGKITATCLYNVSKAIYLDHVWLNGEKVSETLWVDYKIHGLKRFRITQSTFGVAEFCLGNIKRVEFYDEQLIPKVTFLVSKQNQGVISIERALEVADIVINHQDMKRSQFNGRLTDFKPCDFTSTESASPMLKAVLNWTWFDLSTFQNSQ